MGLWLFPLNQSSSSAEHKDLATPSHGFIAGAIAIAAGTFIEFFREAFSEKVGLVRSEGDLAYPQAWHSKDG